MGILQWAAAIDTAGTLARAVKRMDKGALDSLADQPAADAGTVAQIQARLAGVAVAAIKEVFDRDSARLEMERAQLEAERQRALVTAESSYAFDIETAEGLARVFGQGETTWTVRDEVEYLARLRQVTVDQIREAARRYFRDDNYVRVRFVPTAAR